MEVKFSIYMNRRVFVMKKDADQATRMLRLICTFVVDRGMNRFSYDKALSIHLLIASAINLLIYLLSLITKKKKKPCLWRFDQVRNKPV